MTHRVDAHRHFWSWSDSAVDYSWMEGPYQELQRDYLAEHAAQATQDVGPDLCVAVQARQVLVESDFLLGLADAEASIVGVVGWVDLCSPGVGETLENLAANSVFRGVRHWISYEPDVEFMLRPDFIRGINQLTRLDLTYDLMLLPQHLPVAARLAKLCPDQRFVLDHMAGPPIADGGVEPWADGIRGLAAAPNVSCKLSGFTTLVEWRRWTPKQFKPFIDVAVKAFGVKRVMFGSDWPVCTCSSNYAEVVRTLIGLLEGLSPSDLDAVLGGNAVQFYGLAKSRNYQATSA